MITAEEARKETQQQIDAVLINEWACIENAIEEAIGNGKFSISETGYISDKAKNRLVSLGYVVEVGSQYNEPYYSIRWR